MVPSVLLEAIASNIAKEKEQKDLEATEGLRNSANPGFSSECASLRNPSSATNGMHTTSSGINIQEEESPTSSMKDLKILYAEDNQVNQKVFRRVLKALGINEVDIVENGKDAVDITAKNDYDLIFMDMQVRKRVLQHIGAIRVPLEGKILILTFLVLLFLSRCP